MVSALDGLRRLAGEGGRAQVPALVVGLGHGTNHWISATLYVLLPFIVADLGFSYAEIGTLVTLFHATSLVANVGSGPLVDLSGRHVVFQAAALLIGGAALIALGFADNAVWLGGLIMAMGLATSIWHPPALTFLARQYPKGRGFALALHNLGASLGDMLAPLAAGFLLLALTWQETALVSSIPLFVMAAVILFMLSEPTGEASGPARPGRAGYLQSLAVMVRRRELVMLFLMAGVRSMTQNGLLVFLPLYLVGALKASPAVVGTTLMAMQIGGMVAGPLAGAWSDRVGRRPVVLAGLGSSTLLIASITAVEGTFAFICLVGVLGFCVFAVRPVVHGWAMDLTARETSGSAVSLLFMAQSGFTMTVPIAGGFIADIWGLETVFYILTVTCLIATAIVFFMPNSRQGREAAPA